jgi:hypothetical protein
MGDHSVMVGGGGLPLNALGSLDEAPLNAVGDCRGWFSPAVCSRASLFALDQNLDDMWIGERRNVTDLIRGIFSNFAQDTAHDFA